MSTATAAPPHIVLYDDACPMCTFQSRALTWLDWRSALRFAPLSGGEAARLVPGLTREQLAEAIHCVARDGCIHRGARCIRFVGLRLPALVPMALVLWLPGVIQIAELIYRWISRHRQLLSRIFGCQGACALLPARVRPADEAR